MSFDTYIGIIFAVIIAVGIAFIPMFCSIKHFKSNQYEEKKKEKNKRKIISFTERKSAFKEINKKPSMDYKISIYIAIFGVILIICVTAIYIVKKPSTYNNNIDMTSLETDSTESEQDEFSVVASYDMNVQQVSLSGIDVLIKAETTFPADHVTISAVPNFTEDSPFDMHGGTYEWYFKANFYIKGTYAITITAYDSDDQCTSDVLEFVY